jgi:cell division septation protein DedD
MHRTLACLALTAAGGAIAMAIAAPAHAQAGTIPINGDYVPTTAQEFKTQECAGPFQDLPENQDGWHFVLPGSSGTGFESVTLTFDTPDGVVEMFIDSHDATMPDPGVGSSGYLDDAGGDFIHAYAFTEAGWTLTAGSAQVGDAEDGGSFSLNGTCSGALAQPIPTPPATATPTPIPTATPTPTPTGTPTATPSATVSPFATGPGMPANGQPVAGVVAVGGGLVAGGLGLLAARRRRYSVER